MVIAVDVDETVADLLGELCRLWNSDPDLRAKKVMHRTELTDWGMPEEMYEFFQNDDLYENILPIPGALEAVEELREYGRVVFVTACVPGTADQKMEWLQHWGFLPRGFTLPDFIAAKDKSLVAADVIIDDNVQTVRGFPGVGVLVSQPHNQQAENTDAYRIDSIRCAPWLIQLLVKHNLI